MKFDSERDCSSFTTAVSFPSLLMKDTGSTKDVQFTEDCRLVDGRARAFYPGVPPPRSLLMRREGRVVGDPRETESELQPLSLLGITGSRPSGTTPPN